jgi:predicted regulator of Ras-like GTPase activity (Roadblock/LC7/MglB family)
MSNLSIDAQNLNWLVANFASRVPGARDAVVVSSDGLLMALSPGLDRAGADQLAAIASGLTSLTRGASRCFGGGRVNQVVVELEHAFLFVTSISDGSALAVIANGNADVGLVGYEMTLLVERASAVLSPALIAELQASLPRR